MSATHTHPPHRRRRPRHELAWHDAAGCRDLPLNLFFAPEGERQADRWDREDQATAICRESCPVRTECLRDALERRDLWGVRGGLAPEQLKAEHRKRLRRTLPERRAAA